MSGFKIIKRGYSQLEVDSYIEKLKNDYEARLAEQKDRIFYLKDQLDKITNSSDNELMTSLVSAVERAKVIENSSKNIYELETKKLSLLYSKMENLLSNENICNDKDIKNELLFLIQDCRSSLQQNISMQNDNINQTTIADPVKKLLSKMINFNRISPLENREESSIGITQLSKKDSLNLGENILTNDPQVHASKTVQIKRQDTVQKFKNQENNLPNNFEKFLSKNDEINGSNFETIMFSNDDSKFGKNKKQTDASAIVLGGDLGDYAPNESGFDLKEAINPKEDLDEIMKSFDFFNDNKKK